MSREKLRWTIKLDWSRIINLIGLDSITEIPEDKRLKALEEITDKFGTEELLHFDPPEDLDELVSEELKSDMKKQLNEKRKQKEKIKKKFKGRMIPMKNGGIFKFNLNDLKDLKDLDLNQDPKDLLRNLYKKIMTDADEEDDTDDDDDDSRVREDRTGYYI